MTKLKNELDELKGMFSLSQHKLDHYRYENGRLINAALQLSKHYNIFRDVISIFKRIFSCFR